MTDPTSPPSFDHGVASFDPTSDAVLLWTRIETPTPIDWVVARDPSLADVVRSGTTTADPDADHTVTVDVSDLDASTTYFYGFVVDGTRSRVGRTRTLPEGDCGHARIGVTCCADDTAAPFAVYRALADREVDVVLHLGDYIYEAPTSRTGRRRDLESPCVTLEDYRVRYATVRADPDLIRLHERHPMLTIWDDHDFADNSWRTGAKAHDPAEHGDWEPRAQAAIRARREWLPIRPHDPARPDRIWRSLALGDLAEVVLLDTRFEGRDRHAGDEDTLPRDHPQRSLLGDDQRAWMDERLADVSRPWSLVASGVVVNEFTLPIPGGALLPTGWLPNGYALFDGTLVHDDQWDGYTAEQAHLGARLHERMQAGGATVLLSGDVHSSWAFEGPVVDGVPVAVEAVCPAVSSAPMGRVNVALVNRLVKRASRHMDLVHWSDVHDRGYVVVDVTPERVQTEWWGVDVYALDPAERAVLLHAAVVRRDGPVGRFVGVDDATPDPVRAEVPQPAARPDGLRALRRKRFARIAAETVAALAPIAVAGALVANRRRGR